jgi:hypothetical protein
MITTIAPLSLFIPPPLPPSLPPPLPLPLFLPKSHTFMAILDKTTLINKLIPT